MAYVAAHRTQKQSGWYRGGGEGQSGRPDPARSGTQRLQLSFGKRLAPALRPRDGPAGGLDRGALAERDHRSAFGGQGEPIPDHRRGSEYPSQRLTGRYG